MRETLSFAVGRKLGAMRQRTGASFASVCRSARISPNELLAIEEGRSHPSVAVLDRVARALGSTLKEIVCSVESSPDAAADRAFLGLDDIARAIAGLAPNGESKVDRAAAAALVHALDVSAGNQSAAARLLEMERKKFARGLARAQRRSKGGQPKKRR